MTTLSLKTNNEDITYKVPPQFTSYIRTWEIGTWADGALESDGWMLPVNIELVT